MDHFHDFKLARLCRKAGACILMLFLGACAAGSALSLFSGRDPVWAVALEHGKVRSLSVLKGKNPINASGHDYVPVSDSHTEDWSVAVYYDTQAFGQVDGSRMHADQLTGLAARFLRGLFESSGKGVALSLYNVPEGSRLRAESESPADGPIVKVRLYFAAPVASTPQQRRVALKNALSIALHEATHAMQDLFTPDMSRDEREERASLVQGCFRAAALSGTERLLINNDDLPHSVNPVINASNMASNRVARRFEQIFGNGGLGADDTKKRKAVAAECSRVLPTSLVSSVFN